MEKFIVLLFFTFSLLNLSCSNKTVSKSSATTTIKDNTYEKKMDMSEREKDEIYSLLAYSIVYLDWQDDDRNGRGYNVGSVLVNPENIPIAYALNSINVLNNSTKHGEIILMSEYLSKNGIFNLSGYTIYSTLEPCAMCAGMMIMTSVKRTVNGQNDKFYSKALERFSIDTRACGGYEPYPRTVISDLTPSNYANLLSKSYEEYISKGNKAIITKFLSTQMAKELFKSAFDDFLKYEVKYETNKIILLNARNFLEKVKEEVQRNNK